jgi:2-polyprenyl-3-methyl-5-hydroxy-6-metoxy-1,4-benzoquinol methylase
MSPAGRTGELSGSIAPADLDRAIRELGPEPRRCVVCGGTSFARLFRRSEKWFWRCARCELVFVHDIYPEFVADTQHLDGTYVFDRLERADRKKTAKFDEFLGHLEPHRRLGRLLDVGCGQGLFLARARERGWRVAGVEILEPVAARARERGLEVFHGTLEEARFPEGSFDAVTLREVIEHVVDPVALLSEIARVLRPGGVAALGTGNAGSWAARLRGGRWAYYRFGGHLHIRFYSPPSAAALGRAAGFAEVECHTRGFAFLEAEEMRGLWYRPFLKIAQAPLSTLATAAGAGHRLLMLFHKGPRAEA